VSTVQPDRMAMRWTAGAAGLGIAGYALYAGAAWLRYGHPARPHPEEVDPLLDRFLPWYDVVERHHIRVAAPPAITLAAAAEMDLSQSMVVRSIFKARELVLRAQADADTRSKGLLAQTLSLGWRVLADVPGREVVVGAVTRPWEANVVFRGLTADEFAAFWEPDYVKIAWTLRAVPVGAAGSEFRTETRAVATSAHARRRFRWYWARFSPGIILIRRLSLGLVKREAERRARANGHALNSLSA
jgi:hypothetical protein